MATWEQSRLGDLVETQKGYAFKSGWYSDAGRPIVKVSDFTTDSVDSSSLVCIPEEIAADYLKYELRVGDVVIQTVGSWPSNPASVVGKCVRIPSAAAGALLNQNAVKLSPSKALDAQFLFYLLRCDDFKTYIIGTAQGAASQAAITLEAIRSYEFAAPSLPVQRRIAGIMSAYDELMENSQRRIRLLEAMARALYREWFVHFRFPGHEKGKMVRPLSHPSEGSAKTDGDIPQGWEVKPFSAIASYVNGYPFKPVQLGTEGKPIIKIKELKAGIVADTPRNLGDEIPEKYNIRDGDVLFSWSADLDTYLWMGGEGLLNQHLFNVVPFDGISRAFCFHALKGSMPRFRALSLGATMHHIKRSALDQVFTLLPPAALRKRFETLVEPMHHQLITLTKHVENLRRTRDLLLPRLLSGQVEFL